MKVDIDFTVGLALKAVASLQPSKYHRFESCTAYLYDPIIIVLHLIITLSLSVVVMNSFTRDIYEIDLN